MGLLPDDQAGRQNDCYGALAHHGGENGMVGGRTCRTTGFRDGFTIPGLLELGTMLGFLALFVYVVFNRLTKASLLPKNDPYLLKATTIMWKYMEKKGALSKEINRLI